MLKFEKLKILVGKKNQKARVIYLSYIQNINVGFKRLKDKVSSECKRLIGSKKKTIY